MPIRERRGTWHYRFKVNGQEYTAGTDLAATERNRAGASRIEAKARELVLQGRAHELRLEVITFSAAAEKYLTWADAHYQKHPNSALRIRTSFASLALYFGAKEDVEKRFRDVPVASVTAGSIEDYKAWRLNEHQVKPITVRHDLHALSGFFQYAQKHNWCRMNPVEKVEIPSDEDAVRMHVLGDHEERLYFATAKLHGYTNLYDLGRLMIEQGCRPDEILTLEKKHINLENGTVLIARGKSKAARRELWLTAESRGILSGRMHTLGSWVFPSPKRDGEPLTKLNNAHESVLRATERCKCGGDRLAHEKPESRCREFRRTSGLSFVIYDLRHTFATRAAERGMAPATLAAILGHADLRSITKYVHVRKDAMHQAMWELDKPRVIPVFDNSDGGPDPVRFRSTSTREITGNHGLSGDVQ